MPKTHIMRVIPPYFDDMANGNKPFEIRLGTFNKATTGDTLVIKEWTGKEYTGREITKRVTSMVRTHDLKFWTKAVKNAHGFVIMGLGEPNGE